MKPVFTTSSEEIKLLDTIDEEFCNDGDVMSHLSAFARGLLSPEELKERLIAEREHAERRAEQIVFGGGDSTFDHEHPDDVSCFSRRRA